MTRDRLVPRQDDAREMYCVTCGPIFSAVYVESNYVRSITSLNKFALINYAIEDFNPRFVDFSSSMVIHVPVCV